jgi:hypothetical protein
MEACSRASKAICRIDANQRSRQADAARSPGPIGYFVGAASSFLATIRDQIVNGSEFCRQLNLVRIAFKSFPQRLPLGSQFQRWDLDLTSR